MVRDAWSSLLRRRFVFAGTLHSFMIILLDALVVRLVPGGVLRWRWVHVTGYASATADSALN